MSNIRQASGAVVVLATLLTACVSSPPREREWREGDVIYYTDGEHYQVSVNVALPHYHVSLGKYYQTQEESATHFHIVHNPKAPPTYVRCFARQGADGPWIHQPQWRELDPRRRMDGRGIGNWD